MDKKPKNSYFSSLTSQDTRTKESQEKAKERDRVKKIIQEKLTDYTKNKTLFGTADERLIRELKANIRDILAESRTTLLMKEQEDLTEDIIKEATSLGKISHFMDDPEISEIMVNRFDSVFIEKKGVKVKSDVIFDNEEEVKDLAKKIASSIGRNLNFLNPIVDARLGDGSRVNIVLSGVSIDGTCITIRKFFKEEIGIKDLIRFGTVSEELGELLEALVISRANIVVSGGTSAGKTTLLNVISNFIPDGDRVLTIEDAAELQLSNPHVLRLEARMANNEGAGGIDIRRLVSNSLRQAPDRIVVGEVRDETAYDLMQAMNSGHDGSCATVHANDPRRAITRLSNLILQTGYDMSEKSVRSLVGESVDIIVQIKKMSDNVRRVTHVTESVFNEKTQEIDMNDLYRFVITGAEEDGKLVGSYVRTENKISKELQAKMISHRIKPERYEGRKGDGVDTNMDGKSGGHS